ncbi:uncharacterized protein SPPG_08120 [Spizellomyces punctatus DAOM BR117]|uniref:Ubiquitin-like protease family profile domain-containing protein n=1 Tax=Spizellomyces punctatus (strain DAOM BR117) TaxID=645134 RepID=A0A0L0H5N9_SPIPD|nr:uncharacterized protein SPPG_08120 [Spizellomyces punctatus DAOM BR117]KNC96532.1 hypothetical protein SPPG_08120 [Spizellomyces punctatus DAOM BR117]|eukprot:XP_016604572.1 hypothetical protein SPPG_08120 [Spizellomyces punctatus DAOM BR117]
MTTERKPILEWHDIILYPEDVALLDDGQWLNDAIISFHYEWMERELFKNDPAVLFMRPTMVALVSQSAEPVDALKGVLPPNLNERAFVWMPINDGSGLKGGGSHWSLLVWHAGGNTFYYFDSLKGANVEFARQTAERITPLLKQEGQTAPGFEIVNTPQQTNGYDCGIYVCSLTGYIGGHHLLPAVNNPEKLSSPEFAKQALQDPALMRIDDAAVAAGRKFLKETIFKLAENEGEAK